MVENEQNIIIKSNLADNKINGDKFQLKRVIINLLSNAIIYGNKKSNIELKLDEDVNNFSLSVKNKSNYIPEDKINDLYEKFKRKDNIKFQKSGTGLGLYLSKQIIVQHNGNIFAKSDKEEQSCTFGFSLPKKPHIVNLIRVPRFQLNHHIDFFSFLDGTHTENPPGVDDANAAQL